MNISNNIAEMSNWCSNFFYVFLRSSPPPWFNVTSERRGKWCDRFEPQNSRTQSARRTIKPKLPRSPLSATPLPHQPIKMRLYLATRDKAY